MFGNSTSQRRWHQAVIIVAASAAVCLGQDTRHVVEPSLRPACTVLKARITSSNGKIASGDEGNLDTSRVQEAIDHCRPGEAVELATGSGGENAFLSGALHLKSNVALRIDRGVTLFASRNPRDFDLHPGSCGILSRQGHGCLAVINGDHVPHTSVEGDGVIDGRGGEKILGQNISWWDLAEQARGTDKNQNCPRLVQLFHSDDFVLYRIMLRNSPNFHVYYSQGNGFTVWGVKVYSPARARNTDGIDPASSSNITITHSFIHTGDDQVAIKAGDTGPSTHITIAHNHFYTGHGVSIGSETNGGASAIRVSDLTIDGADNGIRIKSNSSRGGLVQDIAYDDVCIRNTKNPILMDSNYSFYGKSRDKLPTFRDITLSNILIEGGGKLTFDGYDAKHLLEMKLSNIRVEGPKLSVSGKYAEIHIGPASVGYSVNGPDVNMIGKPSSPGATPPCAAQFVPMPAIQ